MRIIAMLVLFWVSAVTLTVSAQDIVVKGQFLADSMRVGDEIFFSMSARYPAQEQLLFPDSSFFYGPFEFSRKRFFVTETKNGISFDSAIYHLTTFETDSLLRLRLPVYRVNALDCTRYMSPWDTVKMQLMVNVMPEKIGPDLPLRATIAYQDVPISFNFPLLLAMSGMTLLLAGVVWIVFGDRFKRYYLQKRLKKEHEQFLTRYNKELEYLRTSFSVEKTETALLLWKKYMEQLNRKPYTKLTTRETLRFEKDSQLATNLRRLDAAIYGSNTDVLNSLDELGAFATVRFDQKAKEVANG